MGELAQRTFRISVDVTVIVRAIDDERAAATRKSFHNDALAADPQTDEWLARDRRLLAAVLARPELLRSLLLRQAVWSLEFINPADDSLDQIRQSQCSDVALVTQLQDTLPPDDYQYLRDVADEDLFYDNTMFFQDAFAVRQANFHVADLREPNARTVSAGDPPAQ